VDSNISVDHFFAELLDDTERKYKQSPVYQKQLTLDKQWNYAVCATPIAKRKGVIFGINWGGTDNFPQTVMPTGGDISDYNFIKQSRQFLEKNWGLDIEKINFNYTNLCFFRTPKAKDLSDEDYKLSLPLFEKYIRYINPPWILSIGGTNFKMLGISGALKNVRQHFDKQGKFKGYSGQLWDWNIFSVPHPSAWLTSDARQTIWDKVTAEMKATNR
jgi:hypothetical protein